jgi:hypothetical protein
MTGSDILRAFEIGAAQPPIEQALTLLACSSVEPSFAELVRLSIGQRDALLFNVREQLFGGALRGAAECPACGQRLHFSTQLSALRVAPDDRALEAEMAVSEGEWALRFRVPDSQDLRLAAACGEVAAGRQRLIESCLLSVQRAGEEVRGRDGCAAIPESLLSQMAALLGACDAQGEVLLNMTCAHCEHEFSAIFDIATFLWTEVAAQAQRLVREVDALARTYGWREADILAMSASRRRLYFDLVNHE